MTHEFKPNKATKGIVIDWETSGNDWDAKTVYELAERYQGVSVGAIVFDTTTLEPIENLYIEIKFDENEYAWHGEAEAIHGLSRAHLEAVGVSQEDAAVQLGQLILRHFHPQEPILFLGHNTEYDKAFTHQLLDKFGIMFKIHNTHLDTSGTGYINFGIHTSNDIFHFLGLPERQEHNALEDCKYTLESAKRMRLLMQTALGQLTQ